MAAARLLGPTVDGHTTTTTRSGGGNSAPRTYGGRAHHDDEEERWRQLGSSGLRWIGTRGGSGVGSGARGESGAGQARTHGDGSAAERSLRAPPFSVSHLQRWRNLVVSSPPPRTLPCPPHLQRRRSPCSRTAAPSVDHLRQPPRPHAVGSRGKGEDRGKGKRN